MKRKPLADATRAETQPTLAGGLSSSTTQCEALHAIAPAPTQVEEPPNDVGRLPSTAIGVIPTSSSGVPRSSSAQIAVGEDLSDDDESDSLLAAAAVIAMTGDQRTPFVADTTYL